MRIRLLFTAALASAVTLPSAAMASAGGDTRFAEDISYADLDLSTSEGASRLEQRVRDRVRQMCDDGHRDLASRWYQQKCQAMALADTNQKVRIAIASANADRTRMALNTTLSATETPGA